jgi:hypothetical protein
MVSLSVALRPLRDAMWRARFSGLCAYVVIARAQTADAVWSALFWWTR